MSKIDLYRPQAFEAPAGATWDAPSGALELWSQDVIAAEADDPNTISIYDPIGFGLDGGDGVTARRIAAALRQIGENDVTVNINSPGGDMFEGLAIYNLLAEHPASVNVRVMGLAASAASIIAMAGDTIAMGLGSQIMIHNAWGLVMGNRNDMREAADMFAQFDGAMARIYEHRTGQKAETVAALMDAETFMGADQAVEMGFATDTFQRDKKKNRARSEAKPARAQLDAFLAKHGMPRVERRRLLKEAGGMPGATVTDMPGAVEIDAGLAASLLETIKP